MTREEAISIMNVIVHMLEPQYDTDRIEDAVAMAIEALEQLTSYEQTINKLTKAISEQEPCDDAISRQAIQDYIAKYLSQYLYNDVREAIEVIDEYIGELPSVKPQEPKTGHWIEAAEYSDGNHKIECSECKSHIFDRGHANSFNVKNKYKYCPNCGCRMVESQESEA